MEALIGIVLLTFLWLTILTRSNREQKAKNKILEKRNRYYASELLKLNDLLYGKESKKESKEREDID